LLQRRRSPTSRSRTELEGRRGMLARVLETGDVRAGDEIELL
jgi:MOSC domain-containing protein YiiM